MKKLNKDIIKKYASGDYTSMEEQYVEEQLGGNTNTSEIKELLREDWNNLSDFDDKKDLNPVLKNIHENIKSIRKEGKLVKLFRTYSRIAAVLLPLAVLFALPLYQNDDDQSELAYTSIHAPKGAKVQFTLPDGTNGWLKGGSELSYPVIFNERHVSLKGEAYFDVAHDKKRPFEVVGADSKVVVLGTKFSANMWPDHKTTEVVLESGKVKFVLNHNDESTLLAPGQRLIYNKSTEDIAIEAVEAHVANAWVNGVLIFRGEDLKEVAQKLSDWYNVEVVLEGSYPQDFQFRATFKNESIREVLRLLKMTAPITYKIIDRQKLDDGTFSKGKVILKMSKR